MHYSELPIKIEGVIFRQNQDQQIEILLLQRSEEDGGFWQPLTGTLEFEESLIDCLTRELEEETGLSNPVRITEEVYRFSWPKKDYTVVELVYGIEVAADAEVKLSHEHQNFVWLSFDEAFAKLEKENNKKAFQAFKEAILS